MSENEFVDEEFEEELTEEQEEQDRFVCDSDSAAEWCLRKKKEAEDKKAEWKAHFDREFEKICRRYDWTISVMERHLRRYFETVPHKETKTQASYPLPSGKLVLKRQAPEYERDDDLLIAWLKASGHSHLVVQKEAVNWQELKRTLTIVGGEQVANEDGEIVPGIIVHERPDKFIAEVK